MADALTCGPCSRWQLRKFPGNKYEIAGGSVTQNSFYTQNVNKWANIGFMSLFVFGFFMLAWIALAFGKFTKR